MKENSIVILDFGSQYNQLIARRVREMGVYAEVVPYFEPLEKILARKPKGIILSGGPSSVCKQYGCMVSLGTDSHISYDIGNFEQAERLLNNTSFPEKYIINSSLENLENFLRLRKNLRVKDI